MKSEKSFLLFEPRILVLGDDDLLRRDDLNLCSMPNIRNFQMADRVIYIGKRGYKILKSRY